MRTNQKHLGNKGFSLVELIVVIAIMAVLIGVLAPVLIKNVEKSKESTDVQNLDTIRGAVTTALSNEVVYDEIRKNEVSGVTKIDLGVGDAANISKIDNTKYPNLKKDLDESVKSVVMKSKAGKTGNVVIKVENGKVSVGVYSSEAASGNAISCDKLLGSTFYSD